MSPFTVARLALTLAGLVLFGYGVRADLSVVRWVGIALVAIALLLRFVPTQPPRG